MKQVRYGLIALALVASVGTAFATKSNTNSKATLYDVLSTNTDGTYTVRIHDGSGSCDPSDNACEISSSQPLMGTKISQTGATVVQNGDFSE